MLLGFLGIMLLVQAASIGAQAHARQLMSAVSSLTPGTAHLEVYDKTPSASLPPLRIAFMPMISPEDAYVKYKGFVDTVAAALGRSGELIVRSSYEEINSLVASGQCDVALVCTSAYVHLKRNHNAKLLVAAIVNSKFSYQSYVIVHVDSKFQTIDDLEGHSFAYDDATSTSGWLYPTVLLKEHGKNPKSFFSKRTELGSNDRAVFAVLNREFDGAAISSIVYENMTEEVRRSLRVIERSPAFAMPPMVTPAGIDEELREALLNVTTSLHETEAGRAVLKTLHIDRILPVYDAMYQSVEEIVDRAESE